MARSNQLFQHMIEEVTKVAGSDSLSATVIVIYVFIDTLAYLSMPLGQTKNKKTDFIKWVDQYLKTDASQSYQYNGKDMYGSRCGILHTYSPSSNYSKNNKCKHYGYHNGPDHLIKPDESLVLLSVNRLGRDFLEAILRFLEASAKDSQLEKRINSRIHEMCEQYSINENDA